MTLLSFLGMCSEIKFSDSIDTNRNFIKPRNLIPSLCSSQKVCILHCTN